MKRTVFYSWQSDLPKRSNRSFIERALENSAKRIRSDGTLDVEPVIERDTDGVAGSPDIAGTIFEKIDRTDVFVCDISIINKGAGRRPTPNPNVLIELGYAVKTIGWERIILVMNVVFGKHEDLPFDLRSRRVLSYSASEEPNEKEPEQRKMLEGLLERRIREIVTGLEEASRQDPPFQPSLGSQAIDAIENDRSTQPTVLRKYLTWLNDELDSRSEPLSANQTGIKPDELLVQAIDATEDLVSEFARVVTAAAIAGRPAPVTDIYRNFALIVDRYSPASGSTLNGSRAQTDFYKFIGHELFVSMIAILLKEEKLELIGEILRGSLDVTNGYGGIPGTVSFVNICESVQLLEHRNSRQSPKFASLHAQILNGRHSLEDRDSELAHVVPMLEFIGADIFLFLRGKSDWFPVSSVCMNRQVPKYLAKATNSQYARRLSLSLGIDDVASLRKHITEGMTELGGLLKNFRIFSRLPELDPNMIASD